MRSCSFLMGQCEKTIRPFRGEVLSFYQTSHNLCVRCENRDHCESWWRPLKTRSPSWTYSPSTSDKGLVTCHLRPKSLSPTLKHSRTSAHCEALWSTLCHYETLKATAARGKLNECWMVFVPTRPLKNTLATFCFDLATAQTILQMFSGRQSN